jgi:hypothetical protein
MSARFFQFPNPVNEVSARLVASGVIVMGAATLVFDQPWILTAIAYGFLARLTTGPRLSPLALIVTHVVTPRLPLEPKLVPGPPKRFAQGIGAALSMTALVLHFGFELTSAAYVLVGTIVIAATLEAAFGFCVGCKLFALLMRSGIIPTSVCVECADIRSSFAAATPGSRRSRQRT